MTGMTKDDYGYEGMTRDDYGWLGWLAITKDD